MNNTMLKGKKKQSILANVRSKQQQKTKNGTIFRTSVSHAR